MTYGLMVLGSWVKATGSGLSCPDWPKCYGEWLPPFPSIENNGTYQGQEVTYSQAQILYEWSHRLVASILGPFFLAYAWLAFRGDFNRPTRLLPAIGGIILVIQIGIGGLTVLQQNDAWATTLHLATATLFFFVATLSAAFIWLKPRHGPPVVKVTRPPPVANPGEVTTPPPEAPKSTANGSWKATVKDYVEISKPRIMLLLVIVAWAAMFMASRGWPGTGPMVAVTAAGILSTAASGAFNNVYEIDRDRKMARTAKRAVADGRIPVTHALAYGTVMALLSFLALAVIEAWLAAFLTLGAIAYYVIFYTAILKPATAQAVVIGGFAGSFPALIGWAAVTGTLALPAWILALVLFFWSPAHFWALALLYKEDYAAADYPMMPSVAGDESTRRQIMVYTVLTIVSTFLLLPYGPAGWVYLVAAALFGFALLRHAEKLLRHPSPKVYRSFFLFTIQYLGLLLIALIIDQVAHIPL